LTTPTSRVRSNWRGFRLGETPRLKKGESENPKICKSHI
jgi:hypothetical protein